MNRDEKRGRFAALVPAISDRENHRALFPREPTGGTWISVNDAGVCLALVNWHRIDRKQTDATVSRGLLVRELSGKSTVNEIAAAVKKLPVRRMRAFRLIAVVPSQKRVIEWRWNLERLSKRNHEWRRQHWFSSGFDEHRAEVTRQRICDAAKSQNSAETLTWLRQLHRSHAPERGPFSMCMHRSDAVTVSYTEVAVSKQSATMRYKSGSPCSNRSTTISRISLTRAS